MYEYDMERSSATEKQLLPSGRVWEKLVAVSFARIAAALHKSESRRRVPSFPTWLVVVRLSLFR